jgi:hypothetical protein
MFRPRRRQASCAQDEWLMTDPEPDDKDRRHADNMAVLAVAAIIVIVALILFHFISKNLETERCLEEHRHGCGESEQQ